MKRKILLGRNSCGERIYGRSLCLNVLNVREYNILLKLNSTIGQKKPFIRGVEKILDLSVLKYK